MSSYQTPHQIIPSRCKMQAIVKYLVSECLSRGTIRNLTLQIERVTIEDLESLRRNKKPEKLTIALLDEQG